MINSAAGKCLIISNPTLTAFQYYSRLLSFLACLKVSDFNQMPGFVINISYFGQNRVSYLHQAGNVVVILILLVRSSVKVSGKEPGILGNEGNG